MPRRHNQYNGIHTPAMLHHNGLIEENGGLHHEALERVDPGGGVGSRTECCVPNGCEQGSTIDIRDLSDVVKVLCNNENCKMGPYMHRECFEAWEETVLTYLRNSGRARSWSEKQRHQNLWTKRGYDLAFKACGCRCNRGHLKKDLDWRPPLNPHREAHNGHNNRPQDGPNGNGVLQANNHHQKKKRRNRNNNVGQQIPMLGLRLVQGSHHGDCTAQAQNQGPGSLRDRAGSMSSTGSSPCSSESPSSPVNGMSSSASSASSTGEGLTGGRGARRKTVGFDFQHCERIRHGSDGNGIFSRRPDFSSFNVLPKRKINSYHIKMEDEGYHGNDDIRLFILSTLAQCRAPKVYCMLCSSSMVVFDRYPLIDGTFFLSPRQHSKHCIQVNSSSPQFLSAVCMACLEGWTNKLLCRFCGSRWDGSSLILGTMYSYDIFAATPCCAERHKCNNCRNFVLHPDQRLRFFSDCSRPCTCPFCGQHDYHLVKPMTNYVVQRGHL